jgi:hypothetical protein
MLSAISRGLKGKKPFKLVNHSTATTPAKSRAVSIEWDT